jgi:hypothetical protein
MEKFLQLKEQILEQLIESLDRIIIEAALGERSSQRKVARSNSVPDTPRKKKTEEEEVSEDNTWFPALERMLGGAKAQGVSHADSSSGS